MRVRGLERPVIVREPQDRADCIARLAARVAPGARIEHQEHRHEWLVYFVDLPRALGRLPGRVVRTRVYMGEQTLTGARHSD